MFSLDVIRAGDPDLCSREMHTVCVQAVEGGAFEGVGTESAVFSIPPRPAQVFSIPRRPAQVFVQLPRDPQAAAMGSGSGFCGA